MWQIIKAEYLHAITIGKSNLLPIYFTLTIPAYIIIGNIDLAIFNIFSVGAILSSLEDNRFYLYQKLPITAKRLALARLIMVGINTILLLTIVIPFMIYFGSDIYENLLKLFAFVGILLLIRVFSFSLFDVTSGLFTKLKWRYTFLLSLIAIPIIIAFISIITIYFKKPTELKMMLIALSFSVIPIFTFISIKTFTSKEKITVREK